jgi:single stranded DNA-binding protein (ssb)
MINKVILVGNVGADPEVRRFDSNTPMASFRMATSENYTDKQGVRQTITEWHSIVAWRALAEIVEKYVKKGSQIYIEGRLRTRSYDDANGVKKYVTEIVADTMKLLGRREGENHSDNSSYGQANSAAISSQVEEIEAEGRDDLPF